MFDAKKEEPKTTPVLNHRTTEENEEYWFNVSEPSIEDIRQMVKIIKEHPDFRGSKMDLLFWEPVSIRHNQRNIKTLEQARVKFFEADGILCYTFHSRSGYPLSRMEYRKIIRIGFDVPLDATRIKRKKIESLLNRRFDDQTWSHLTVESCLHYPTTVYNIQKRFPSYVLKQIQEAFEEKKNFSYALDGKKRSWRIETKMCDDGIFRAWFTSEYAGCANGQYFLLLNPTTATFCEDD